MCFKQSSLAYVSNCHNIYLSLAKDRTDFYFKKNQNMTSNVNLDARAFLYFFFCYVVD